MGVKLKNNARTVLGGNITSVQTEIPIRAGDSVLFPTLTTGDWFPLTVVNSLNQLEIMHARAISSFPSSSNCEAP